jgi:hypothetical protein
MHPRSPLTFAAALAAIPAEDWDSNWAADRTRMLRMTTKRVKEALSKLRLPAVVKVSEETLATALRLHGILISTAAASVDKTQ